MDLYTQPLRHPIVATRHLCGVAVDHGLSAGEVLAGTRISESALDDPDADVSDADELTAIRNIAHRLPADPAYLGMLTGLRFNITSLGVFGFAVMSCPTLRDLISLALRFFALTSLQIKVTRSEDDTSLRLDFDATHLPSDVRSFLVARDTAALAMTLAPFLGALIEEYADDIQVEVSEEDRHISESIALLPIVNVAFDRPRNRVIMPLAMADKALPQADTPTMRLCIEQCETLVQRRSQRAGTAAAVRSHLLSNPAGMPSLEKVAESLYLHPRTLRRRLLEEGTTWRTLISEIRATLAIELLQVGMPVADVANRLGYSETSAFTRAFTRWFGEPPTEYRGRSGAHVLHMRNRRGIDR